MTRERCTALFLLHNESSFIKHLLSLVHQTWLLQRLHNRPELFLETVVSSRISCIRMSSSILVDAQASCVELGIIHISKLDGHRARFGAPACSGIYAVWKFNPSIHPSGPSILQAFSTIYLKQSWKNPSFIFTANCENLNLAF